jgi:hypothetical protein
MQVKSDISRGLTRTIAEAVESWQDHYGDPRSVAEVDYLVREALRLCQILQEWRADLWQRAFANQLHDISGAGMKLRRAMERALETIPRLRAGVQEAEELGHTVAQAAELEQAVATVQRLKEDLIKRWIWFDWRKQEQVQAALEAGAPTVPLEAAFDELRAAAP